MSVGGYRQQRPNMGVLRTGRPAAAVSTPSARPPHAAGAAMPSEFLRMPLWVTLTFSGFITLWYLQVSYRIPALGAVRFELLVPTALAVVALFCGQTLRSPLTPFVLFLLVCIGVQVPLSADVSWSWTVFVDRVVKFAVVGLLIARFVTGPRELKWFLGAFLIAMLKLGQEGVAGVVTGSLMWENQGVMRLHGSTPVYQHPNSFSGMAVGILPFVLFLWPVAARWQKAILATLGVFAVTIIVFTASRTGYVATAGLLVFSVLRSKHKARAGAFGFVVVLAAAMLTPDQYKERFSSIFTQEEKEGASTEARIEILRDAVQVLGAHPFGVGVGAFPVVRQRLFGRNQDTHNLYLEVATNLGIQGFVAFALFVGAILVLTGRVSKACDRQLASLQAAFSSGTADSGQLQADVRFIRQVARAVQAFIVARLILGIFGMDLYEIYWWFAAGLSVALHNLAATVGRHTAALAQQVPQPDRAVPRAGWPAFGISRT